MRDHAALGTAAGASSGRWFVHHTATSAWMLLALLVAAPMGYCAIVWMAGSFADTHRSLPFVALLGRAEAESGADRYYDLGATLAQRIAGGTQQLWLRFDGDRVVQAGFVTAGH